MTDLLDKVEWQFMKAKAKIIAALHDEKGEVNMIAIILIIVIVIALAAVFKERIGKVVTSLFKRVDEDINTFDSSISPQ